MFYRKGWVPLSDVAHEVDRINAEMLRTALAGKTDENERRLLEWEAQTDTAFSIWEIAEGADEIGVLLTNGTVAKASRRLVEWDGTDRLSNRHLHVFAGTVGSAAPEAFDEDPQDPEDLDRRYGPFLGLPVLLSQECWDIATGEHFKESEKTTPESRAANIEIAHRIIEMHDADKSLRRGNFKEQLAPSWSSRRFNRAWEIAAQERPELSRPGRRSRGE